jgi:large subunit ribosomal protein L37Ae
MKTKKVGPAGKFGARYGTKAKREFADIAKLKHAKFPCPSCMKPSLKRVASGIWECKACGHKIAGKAYRPTGE